MRPEFQVHLLTDAGLVHARRLAELFSSLLNEIELRCGAEGREMAIVRTKLEEASFYAKKALASLPQNRL